MTELEVGSKVILRTPCTCPRNRPTWDETCFHTGSKINVIYSRNMGVLLENPKQNIRVFDTADVMLDRS